MTTYMGAIVNPTLYEIYSEEHWLWDVDTKTKAQSRIADHHQSHSNLKLLF